MLSGAKGSSHILGRDEGGLLLFEARGPIKWAFRQASLRASLSQMAEGLRYYGVISLIGGQALGRAQKCGGFSRLCTQSGRSHKKKIGHGPRTRVLC